MSGRKVFVLRPGGKPNEFPLPKSGKAAFTGSNSRPIVLLPALCKLLEIMFHQIQCYFSANKLTTDFQHAYSEGHSTCTALTQMTDDWLKEIDTKTVGDILLDFSAAFDIFDHNLLLKKPVLWLFNICHVVDSELSI